MEDIHTKGTLITTPLLQDSSTRAPTVATEVPTHRQISRWTSANLFKWMLDWLVVSTHLKNTSQNWMISPNSGENKKSFSQSNVDLFHKSCRKDKHEKMKKTGISGNNFTCGKHWTPSMYPFWAPTKNPDIFVRFANLPIQVRDRKSLKPAPRCIPWKRQCLIVREKKIHSPKLRNWPSKLGPQKEITCC